MHELTTFDETCMGNILEYGYSTWWRMTLVHIYMVCGPKSWCMACVSADGWHTLLMMREGAWGVFWRSFWWNYKKLREVFIDLCGWWLEKKHKGCGYYVRKTETWLWYTMLKLFLGLLNSFAPISCIIQETKTISYMHAWLQPIKFEWPMDNV